MKYPTLKFIFDRTHKATEEKSATIYLEVLFERKRRLVNTGIKVYSNEWDDKKHVINRPDCTELNTSLDKTLIDIRKILLRIYEDGESFTFEKFDVYMKGSENSGSFLDFMYDQIAKRPLQESTKRQHIVVYDLLVRFNKIKSFKDLTSTMLKAFDDFIRIDNPNRAQVTIYGIHKRLKPYIHEAFQMGYIKENPYDKFNVARGKSKDREYLNIDEINLIKSQALNDRLDRVRDIFLFCCYTGLAYVDLARFNYNKDVILSDGNLFIDGSRQKTGSGFYVMLLDGAIEILKKYNNQLPLISLTNYNLFLKALGSACGIKKNLSSHIARHTFATTITLANGIPLEVVSRMLGHTDIKTTQIYAKVLNTTIEKQMKGLNEKLKK